MPVKHFDIQADMRTHLSQSTGIGAFDGQHGMSDGDISSAIACIGASEDVDPITGWETGASTRPAIIKIASSRRMVILRFTKPDSHRIAANERL